jgi:hypothetical protein
MSKFAALSKMGAMGSKMGAMGSKMGAGMSSRMGAAGTAMRGSSAYQGVAQTAGKEVSITLNYGQIGMIVAFAMSYLVVASLGIDMFSKCDNLEGNTTQENLNKWLVATLAIAITIPVTLLLTKVAGSKLTGIVALLFAVMGIVGSSAVLHWSGKCDAHKDDESKKVYGGINMAVFIVVLLVALFLLRPKGKMA